MDRVLPTESFSSDPVFPVESFSSDPVLPIVLLSSDGFANRVVFVRPGFPGRFVAPGFVGGVATGIVLNPFFFPRSFYFPGPFIHYYPPSSVFSSDYYPPSYAYEVAPPPSSAPAPSDAYDRGYSEGYSQGYEEAQKNARQRAIRGRQKARVRGGLRSRQGRPEPLIPPSLEFSSCERKSIRHSAAKIRTYQTSRRAQRRPAIESRATESIRLRGKKDNYHRGWRRSKNN